MISERLLLNFKYIPQQSGNREKHWKAAVLQENHPLKVSVGFGNRFEVSQYKD